MIYEKKNEFAWKNLHVTKKDAKTSKHTCEISVKLQVCSKILIVTIVNKIKEKNKS